MLTSDAIYLSRKILVPEMFRLTGSSQINLLIDKISRKKLRDQLEFCYVDKQSKKEDSKTRFLAGCNWANTFLGKLHQNIRRSHQAVIIEVKGLEIFNDLLLSNGIMEKGRKKEDESKILADQLWPDVEICMKSLEEAVVCLKASGVLKIS